MWWDSDGLFRLNGNGRLKSSRWWLLMQKSRKNSKLCGNGRCWHGRIRVVMLQWEVKISWHGSEKCGVCSCLKGVWGALD